MWNSRQNRKGKIRRRPGKTYRPLIILLMSSSCWLLACADHQEPLAPELNTVVINNAGLYPEGVDYDRAGQRFLVSSLKRGTIGQVSEAGTYSVFTDDDQLISTLGVRLDAQRNRVLVAIADGGNGLRTNANTLNKLAALSSYNLSTGKRNDYIDLGKLRPAYNHFANDIALDPQGNAYITDSFAPVLYKVTPQGEASIFLETEKFGAPIGAFGLNGVTYHPDGYLIVGKYDEGLLFKVPLANPKAFAVISINQKLVGADGLLLDKEGNLVVTSNAQPNQVWRLNSRDNWRTAQLINTVSLGDVFPTSLTQRGDRVYFLAAFLSALFTGQQPEVAQFVIQKLPF